MNKQIDPTFEQKSMSYEAYTELLTRLLADDKTTGTNQSAELTAYARLNLARMNRIHKTVQISDDLKNAIAAIATPQTWYVLTEGWCGDAAQTLPLLKELASLNNKISFHILLRDENLELMDQYLQHGTSRSIPKLIVVDKTTNTEIFNWGPRPVILQQIYDRLKEEKLPLMQIAEQLHAWYAQDRTVTTQQELLKLLTR